MAFHEPSEMTMSRTTKTPEAKPTATFSPEALQALIEEVSATRKLVAEQMAEIAELRAAKPQAANGKSDVSAKNELQTIRVFKKAGFKDIQPRINVLTFNRWIEAGRRPTEGSKSLKVAGLRLFHLSQTRPLTAEEKAALKAKADEAADANKAKIDAVAGHQRKGKVIPLNGGEASPQ
jgi:hypothetical protein